MRLSHSLRSFNTLDKDRLPLGKFWRQKRIEILSYLPRSWYSACSVNPTSNRIKGPPANTKKLMTHPLHASLRHQISSSPHITLHFIFHQTYQHAIH